MLSVFLSTFILTCLAMLAMGAGLLLGGRSPQGSCGGLAARGLKGECELCAGRDRCRKRDRIFIDEER